MITDDRSADARWIASALTLVVIAGAAPVGLLALLGGLGHATDQRLAAILAFVGALVTAAVSGIGLLLRRHSEERLAREHADEKARLRLDAAMRAGELFTTSSGVPADPATIASSLLALSELGRADLAVALLVDLWDDADRAIISPTRNKVSDETAILVLDAALKDTRPSAQLVAAGLLCRNAHRLDMCQALHWPASVDDGWNPAFGVQTKVLIVEALVQMARKTPPTLNALQSLTVRLYGISSRDPDEHVKGCIGILLSALLPALNHTDVRYLMQAGREITIGEIKAAAAQQKVNPDQVFSQIAEERRAQLAAWSDSCQAPDTSPGAWAAVAS